MTKQKWEVKSHNYQIADTGDYDGYWEVTNGNISLMTKDDPDEDDVLNAVADALNKSECEFYTDDSDKWMAHHYKQEMEKGDREIERLTGENETMRKALEKSLEWIADIKQKDIPLDDKKGMALYHIKWLATEALKTNTQ